MNERSVAARDELLSIHSHQRVELTSSGLESGLEQEKSDMLQRQLYRIQQLTHL